MYILFSNWFVEKIIIIIVIIINMLRFRLTHAKYILYNQALLPNLKNIFNF